MSILETLFDYIRTIIPQIYDIGKNMIIHNRSIVLSSILFFVYIVIYYLAYTNFKSSFFEEYGLYTNILFLSIAVIWGFSMFVKYENKTSTIGSTFTNMTKNFILIVLVFAFIFGIIYFLTANNTTSNLIAVMMNIFIVLTSIYTIYHFTKNTETVKKYSQNKLFALFYHLFFVIPCFFIDTVLFVRDDIKKTPKFVFTILLIQIIGLIIYFGYPYVVRSIYTHNAKMLLDKPVYTDKEHVIGTYENLKPYTKTSEKLDDFNYNYGISGWFFLDNIGANYNSKSNAYTTIFSYGEKPKIEYNPAEHHLRVSMKQGLDGIKIIYESTDILLQRWNNFVVNYDGGNVDVFLNGKLVASEGGSVPYMKYDNVIVGNDEGIPGGACNILYYHNPIHKTSIEWLYEYFRRFTPPVIV
jgi:hypothetical protein